MPTASILTFGCKVNQYDSNTIYDTMVRSGYEIVDPEKNADICVVNTCTVTNSADQKARQIIRRIIRKNPQAKIIVTGCYAESDRQAIKAIPGVSLVFGNREKTEFQRYLNMINNKKLLQIEPIVHDAVREHANFSIGISSSGDRTRAIVKVQDGCSAFCTYCIIPFVRGRMTSRPLTDIMKEVGRIATTNCKEIVITGVHLASYGFDIGKEKTLSDVLKQVHSIDGIERIRLSSIEPMNFPYNLADCMAELPKCQPHFHLPLQAGSDQTLKRMRRRYTVEEYAGLVEKLRSLFPSVGITTDIMVGFPGETDRDFEDSTSFVEEMSFSQLHVFRYSPRRNTPAADYPNQVDPQISTERSKRMIDLGNKLSATFREQMIGKTVNVLVENRREDKGNLLTGFSGNYLRVAVDAPDTATNQILPITLKSLSGETLRGSIAGSTINS